MTVLINDYKKVLDKTMILEPDIFLLEMPPSELPDYLDSLYDGILENYEAFRTAVSYPVPMYVSKPVQNSDGTTHFSWQPSYSYQGYTISYNLQLFTDYNMQNLVLEQDNIIDNNYQILKEFEQLKEQLRPTPIGNIPEIDDDGIEIKLLVVKTASTNE